MRASREKLVRPATEAAATFDRILASMLPLRVVVSSLTTVFCFKNNQVLDLRLAMGCAALIALTVGLSWTLMSAVMSLIWVFALSDGIVYLIYQIFSLRVAGA
jgi:hypothetical protein